MDPVDNRIGALQDAIRLAYGTVTFRRDVVAVCEYCQWTDGDHPDTCWVGHAERWLNNYTGGE